LHRCTLRRPEWLRHKYGQPDYGLLTNLTTTQREEVEAARNAMGDPRMNFDTFTSALLTLL